MNVHSECFVPASEHKPDFFMHEKLTAIVEERHLLLILIQHQTTAALMLQFKHSFRYLKAFSGHVVFKKSLFLDAVVGHEQYLNSFFQIYEH